MANVNITKRAIQEAFLAVLNEKSLGKITVKDITDRCGINRNTFYYHYQDIPALLEEICQYNGLRNPDHDFKKDREHGIVTTTM